MRRGGYLKNPIAFICAVVSACCLFVVFVSVLRLPEAPAGISSFEPHSATKIRKLSWRSDGPDLGVFGEMMIEMLPKDLAFTVFVPSKEAFVRDLRLSPINSSLYKQNTSDNYAIISRVLGFSAVPRDLSSSTLPIGQEVNYDSLSGFTLHASKDEVGRVVVNGVQSKRVDIKKGDIVVHVMDGVVMDADFEQSVQPDDD
ncbi:uncharacterized protein LOC116196926 [Punica granatum]|nr:uncharacterized protein LOC116196926 [Punica granatum]OWM69981.1 hypothetical protein CDL15_Pgr025830 [Punica granatum]